MSTSPPDATLRFTNISLSNWRQFDKVSIDFHPRLTVITGANGSGKSTILSLLAKHFQWQMTYASVPKRDRAGVLHYLKDFRPRKADAADLGHVGGGGDEEDDWLRYLDEPEPTNTPLGPMRMIGEVAYSSSAPVALGVPVGEAVVYDVSPVRPDQPSLPGIVPQQHFQQVVVNGVITTIPIPGAVGPWPGLVGLYFSSFRSPTMYSPLATIPAQFNATAQILEQYIQESRNRYFNLWTGQPNKTAFVAMKEALVAAGVYGSKSEYLEVNPVARNIWLGYQKILQMVLPPEMKFDHLKLSAPEVVIVTADKTEFPVDSVSGGIASVMELSWQIFLRSYDHDAFTVVIDEPENHLHPSLQQSVLPRLINAFPRVSFVVATHSPFVVTSVPDSNVYVLSFNGDGRVESTLLDGANKAAGADDTLRDVLGLSTTTPLWAEQRYNEIVGTFLTAEPSTDTLRSLRDALADLGLQHKLAGAIATFIESEETQGIAGDDSH